MVRDCLVFTFEHVWINSVIFFRLEPSAQASADQLASGPAGDGEDLGHGATRWSPPKALLRCGAWAAGESAKQTLKQNDGKVKSEATIVFIRVGDSQKGGLCKSLDMEKGWEAYLVRNRYGFVCFIYSKGNSRTEYTILHRWPSSSASTCFGA